MCACVGVVILELLNHPPSGVCFLLLYPELRRTQLYLLYLHVTVYQYSLLSCYRVASYLHL
jgi:hypothetical protein